MSPDIYNANAHPLSTEMEGERYPTYTSFSVRALGMETNEPRGTSADER
jgi:hypothetical protein